MTLSELLSFVNFVANKEKSGNTLIPEQYNILLEAVNLDFFRKEYEEAKKLALQLNVRLGSVIFKSGALTVFRERETGVTVTAGAITVSDLAQTYVYWISMITTYESVRRPVEFVSDVELEDRLTNLLAKPIEYYPAAIDNGDKILIYPGDITTVDFTYLRMPAQPVYSWIQDAYDRGRYLEADFYTLTITADANPTNTQTHGFTINYNAEGAVQICNYTATTADGLTKQVLAQKMAESVNDSYLTTGYFASVGVEEFTIYLNSSVGANTDYVVVETGTGAASFTAGSPLEDGTGGSTELEWNEAYHVQLAQEVLSRIGVSLGKPQLEAYVERQRQEDKVV